MQTQLTVLDDFLRGYLVAALWSSTDNSNESGGDPLDDNYDVDDIDPKSVAGSRSECEDFMKANAPALEEYYRITGGGAESAGHDFWLTRNRHGAGFWDRGAGRAGKLLTDAAHVYGGVDPYVGDDGTVYFSGLETFSETSCSGNG